jgi:hypothetical protein
MSVSEGLKIQLERLDKTGAFHINHAQKVELEQLVGQPLNKACNSCSRDFMYKAIKLTQEIKPIIHFKAIPQDEPVKPKRTRKRRS